MHETKKHRVLLRFLLIPAKICGNQNEVLAVSIGHEVLAVLGHVEKKSFALFLL